MAMRVTGDLLIAMVKSIMLDAQLDGTLRVAHISVGSGYYYAVQYRTKWGKAYYTVIPSMPPRKLYDLLNDPANIVELVRACRYLER